MKLFEECVDTGKLRLSVKHKTSPIRHYFVLYIFAYQMAHDTLCNQILDEVIAHCEEISMFPVTEYARKFTNWRMITCYSC